MTTASFLTEDAYLGSIREPLTLNRYNYCLSSYLNDRDPSGNKVIGDFFRNIWAKITEALGLKRKQEEEQLRQKPDTPKRGMRR